MQCLTRIVCSTFRCACKKPSSRFIGNSSLVDATVTVGKHKINYVKCGSGPKSVLLMPGALGSAWTDFRPQLEQLPQMIPNHTVIAWDPPGYGRSTPKRCFTTDFYRTDADCAYNVMQKLGFSGFSVCGWSDGGITGMIMASKFPDAVEKLIIWGANAYLVPAELKIYESIRDVSKWSAKMREPFEKLYGKEYFAQLWGEWVDTMLKMNEERKGDICTANLPNVKAPTFILHGAKDPMIAEEHLTFLRENIKNVECYIYADGKHNIHLRYAEDFNTRVAEFLLKK